MTLKSHQNHTLNFYAHTVTRAKLVKIKKKKKSINQPENKISS